MDSLHPRAVDHVQIVDVDVLPYDGAKRRKRPDSASTTGRRRAAVVVGRRAAAGFQELLFTAKAIGTVTAGGIAGR